MKDFLKTWGVGALKLILAAAFAVSLLAGAAGNRNSRTDFQTMQSAVLAAADLSPMSQGDNQLLRRLYGMDPESFDGLLFYYPTSSMGVEELLLVKFSDRAAREELRAAMEARIAAQIASFEGYGPAQVAMLERALIDVRGNYALLVVAENPDAAEQAFRGAY